MCYRESAKELARLEFGVVKKKQMGCKFVARSVWVDGSTIYTHGWEQPFGQTAITESGFVKLRMISGHPSRSVSWAVGCRPVHKRS